MEEDLWDRLDDLDDLDDLADPALLRNDWMLRFVREDDTLRSLPYSDGAVPRYIDPSGSGLVSPPTSK